MKTEKLPNGFTRTIFEDGMIIDWSPVPEEWKQPMPKEPTMSFGGFFMMNHICKNCNHEDDVVVDGKNVCSNCQTILEI